MNRDDFEDLEARVEARAARLWADAGRPDGGHARFLDQARELVAIEEVDLPTLDARKGTRPVIEEASIQSNLGEFPTLRDQGDEMTYPDPDPDAYDDPYAEDDIRLSDGDASETGGVLPDEDVPGDDLPDITLADADVTASSLDANDDPLNVDLNDDGLPDAEDPDRDAETDADIAIDSDNGATVPQGYDDAEDEENDRDLRGET